MLCAPFVTPFPPSTIHHSQASHISRPLCPSQPPLFPPAHPASCLLPTSSASPSPPAPCCCFCCCCWLPNALGHTDELHNTCHTTSTMTSVSAATQTATHELQPAPAPATAASTAPGMRDSVTRTRTCTYPDMPALTCHLCASPDPLSRCVRCARAHTRHLPVPGLI